MSAVAMKISARGSWRALGSSIFADRGRVLPGRLCLRCRTGPRSVRASALSADRRVAYGGVRAACGAWSDRRRSGARATGRIVQGVQSLMLKVTITRGLQCRSIGVPDQVLRCPWGQTAIRVSPSTVNASVSKASWFLLCHWLPWPTGPDQLDAASVSSVEHRVGCDVGSVGQMLGWGRWRLVSDSCRREVVMPVSMAAQCPHR